MFDWEAYKKRVAWFRQARFGMFIHWGLYSIPARGEWVRSQEQIPEPEYLPFFDEFNPKDYNPREWAKAAKAAGMKYAVLTAKHHDGFCLFDSKLTDFKSTNTPCGRDLVREFVEAFRAEGLRVGLYYSLLDWHHPDYPHYGDQNHPLRADATAGNEGRDFSRYVEYLHGQVKELCTNYGKIDIFWFDFSYKDMVGEKWEATKLVEMVRSYLPDVLMDNRLEASGEGFGSLLTKEPNVYSGDFVSPEQIIPPDGIYNEMGERAVWEACITMNNHWGYCSTDKHFKPADMCIKKLVECVSKGGNLLLNVGPDSNGRIPAESLDILEKIGGWMKYNEDSIVGCGCADIEKPDFGRVTRNGKHLYYHVMEPQIGFVPLKGISPDQIEKVRLLKDGSELQIQRNWMTNNYPNYAFVSFGESPLLPDPMDTVIDVTLK